jgi:hypothetical protein
MVDVSVTSLQVRLLAALLCVGAPGCGVSSGLFTPEADGTPAVDAGRLDAGRGGHALDGGGDADKEPSLGARPPCGSGLGCDPADLGGESCHSLGLGNGTLLCNPTTCTFEISLCNAVNGRVPCGSGPNCDPTNLGEESCETLGMGPGTLTCDAVSCTYDTSLCSELPTGGGGTNGGGGTGEGGAGGLFGGGFFGGGATDAGTDAGSNDDDAGL